MQQRFYDLFTRESSVSFLTMKALCTKTQYEIIGTITCISVFGSIILGKDTGLDQVMTQVFFVLNTFETRASNSHCELELNVGWFD